MNKNCVTFKGRKEGITVVLDADVGFGVIQDTLREKITAAESFLGNSQAAIHFNGRNLTDDEVGLLIDIIKDGSRLEITEIVVEEVTEAAEEAAVEPPAEDGGEEPMLTEAFDNEQMTVYQYGNLRSGRSLRYPGSVVLMGDVNAGAEIVAEGNVIVMGTLRGMVHAGCAGDTGCFVSALSMQPTQLRIADVLIYIPPELAKKNRKKIDPVYAHISNGEIYISPMGSKE
jgi:septum site-determining protein MinC